MGAILLSDDRVWRYVIVVHFKHHVVFLFTRFGLVLIKLVEIDIGLISDPQLAGQFIVGAFHLPGVVIIGITVIEVLWCFPEGLRTFGGDSTPLASII